ncbi:MAG: hypothetical protein IT239_05500 [Bacteroidia bacterium]|nr:hypothetical protein [Bacteroidia bacterium]
MRNKIKNLIAASKKTEQGLTEGRRNFFKNRANSLSHYNQLFDVAGQINNVIFVNNGQSVSVEETFEALQKIEHPVVLIIGGLNSLEDYSLINSFTSNKIDTIIVTGIGKELLAERFEMCDVELFTSDTLEEAVYLSYRSAADNYVVLYSPSTQAIDFNNNLNKRKEIFNQLVQKLIA